MGVSFSKGHPVSHLLCLLGKGRTSILGHKVEVSIGIKAKLLASLDSQAKVGEKSFSYILFANSVANQCDFVKCMHFYRRQLLLRGSYQGSSVSPPCIAIADLTLFAN